MRRPRPLTFAVGVFAPRRRGRDPSTLDYCRLVHVLVLASGVLFETSRDNPPMADSAISPPPRGGGVEGSPGRARADHGHGLAHAQPANSRPEHDRAIADRRPGSPDHGGSGVSGAAVLLSAGSLLSSLTLWAVLAGDVQDARTGAVLAFLAAGPGLLAARFARSLGAPVAAAVGLGAAALTVALAGGVMLIPGAWSPIDGVLVVSSLAGAVAIVDLARRPARTAARHSVRAAASRLRTPRSDSATVSLPGVRDGDATTSTPPRSRTLRHGKVSAAASALVAGQFIRMGGGVAFWTLAARSFSASEVGIAASAVAAMMLCIQLALAGAGSSVIRLYPQTADAAAHLLATAFKFVIVTSFLIAGGFVLIGALTLGVLSDVVTNPIFAAIFVAATVFGTCGSLANEVSVATGRPSQIVVRAGGLSITMLTLLGSWILFASSRSSDVIFSCWAAGELAACVLLALQLGLRRPTRFMGKNAVVRLRSVATRALGQHALTLADRIPPFLMTLVITETMTPELGAYWYAVWMAVLAILLIPMYVGTALFADLVRDAAVTWPRIRTNIARTLAVGGIAALALAVLAGDLLRILGPAYEENGERALQILAATVIPVTVLQTYYAVCRSTDRLREATATALVVGLTAMSVATWLGRTHGLEGVAVAWLACQTPPALWALWRVRRLSSRPPTRTVTTDVPISAKTDEPATRPAMEPAARGRGVE
jgi:O-antigen/teichoic acid export membrane protein